MSFQARGTRRVGGVALLWCALLVGAAETGGAVAPPCADASPIFTTAPSATKPVGDPDTPDEGGHKNSATSTGSGTSSATTTATILAGSPARFDFLGWLHAFLGIFHRG